MTDSELLNMTQISDAYMEVYVNPHRSLPSVCHDYHSRIRFGIHEFLKPGDELSEESNERMLEEVLQTVNHVIKRDNLKNTGITFGNYEYQRILPVDKEGVSTRVTMIFYLTHSSTETKKS